MIDADHIKLTISWFHTAFPHGPAIGDPENTTWGAFAENFLNRREGDKDGPNFVPARFALEADGRHVRRLNANVIARTCIALDIEASKDTGEIPPPPEEALRRVEAFGLACAIYTSHSNRPDTNVRYRIVFPLSAEVAPEIPAPEIMAKYLRLDGVTDRSKFNAASLFYLPSCPDDSSDGHYAAISDGAPINAERITRAGMGILQARQAEADRIADEAMAEAQARREAKIAAGFDPDESLIEKIRAHLDLEQVLLNHGYDKSPSNTGKKSRPKYRHPASSSGQYGADIKNLGGIDRVFSHNATDPLYASNLPAWCSVTALDVFDVVAILDFGGDRKKALTELAKRYNLDKASERKALAGMLFRMLRQREKQSDIETAALVEGERLGLSRDDVRRVAAWVAQQAIGEAA